MLLDLTKIPSFWMTCEKNTHRLPKLENIWNLGIPATKIVGPPSNPHAIGVAAALLGVLKDVSLPALFLEDDATPTEFFKTEINVPENIDCIYIGTTQHGRRDRATYFDGVICTSFDEEYVKIENMLSLHGFVVLSEKYRQHLIDLYTNYDVANGMADDVVADTMHNWNVLAVRKPFFYQDDGHHNSYTLEPLKPIF